MRIEHSLPPGFLGRRPVRMLVVGAGGTGSAILMGLPYLHQAMRVWGHPVITRIVASTLIAFVGCGAIRFSLGVRGPP
jgi:hypothetical protein